MNLYMCPRHKLFSNGKTLYVFVLAATGQEDFKFTETVPLLHWTKQLCVWTLIRFVSFSWMCVMDDSVCIIYENKYLCSVQCVL